MSDTSPEAEAVQLSIYKRMTGSQRVRIAIELSMMTRKLTLSRLRSQHPEWSEFELKRELLRYAFGDQPLPPPLQ